MNKKLKNIMFSSGKLILSIINFCLFVVVLTFLWNWFIYPLISLETSFAITAGLCLISLLISAGFYGINAQKSNKNYDYSDSVIADTVQIAIYLIIWGIAALVQLGV